MNYLIAHDLGTSGNKATIFSTDGELVRSCTKAYNVHYFGSVCAEQDPDDWYRAVVESTRTVMEGIDPKDIAAVSFGGQMMGCQIVDRNGEPLHPCMIWADSRAVKQSERVRKTIPDREFFRITGHRNSPYYGMHKLAWIKDEYPELYNKTYKVLNVKDYIVLKLTGVFATDYSDGAGLEALDITKLKWSEEIIEAAGLSIDKFPDPYPSTHVVGKITGSAARETGLLEGTPVIMGGGDASCATVGSGCINAGDGYAILGSSAWVSYADDKPFFDEGMQVSTWPLVIPGMYCPNGTMQAAGIVYNWMRDVLCAHETAQAQALGVSVHDIVEKEIEKSVAGANSLVFLPYILGERSPRWNENATGAFIGLKQEHTHADLCRSVLEGVSYNLNAILRVFRKERPLKSITLIGGGAQNRAWRQMLADIFDADILIPNHLEEATSMGAAVTGGVGAGVFNDFSAINRFIRTETVVRPSEEHMEAYRSLIPVFDDIYEALKPIYEKLSRSAG